MTTVEHLSQFRNLLINASLLGLEALNGGADQSGLSVCLGM